ncbi:hypothetical protein A3A38_03885 [Candidatus Kaiserbacteria bacterium RIFCSPLOWO2_01_FULL_53_17]|uniref:Elongation factor EFG domain-containing protein n=1 Tax=Candidatus Kaiserbacteria bacterium RIFCSPLOWO2_01_FULL_53_17 TaxID=1798511 RepID=A0A1F6EHX9_9BACT|nr:MAG: hypothetical protein A3A38_03885 [Candidatus Kaiserbacteria bacterium RIFCSPLOWO2_01_FULL_53_17]
MEAINSLYSQIFTHLCHSELFGYTTQLRSLTEGRAVPNLEFSHYAVVPRNVADEVIASRK